MAKILDSQYFSRPATELAPALVGKLICRRLNDGSILRARITETECYYGEEDTACHASHGRTPRTDTLYLPGGVAYVYLCYGMHELFNIVTGSKDHPEAVLLRGVEGADGPGRATKMLGITRAFNRMPLSLETGLWIEDDGASPTLVYLPRVGIAYASTPDRERLWRFRAK